jgi:HAD superfamily hydrolase (TIGR01662 family)
MNSESEIVLVMGYLAAGKSTLVNDFVAQGYHRINRDTTGGSLDGQAVLARQAFKSGANRIVLDNTYITIESRESIIALAKELNVPIRCVWLKTSFEDAQFNACLRMVQKTGKILSPEELKKSKDPNVFPPIALYGARKKFEGDDKTLKHKGKQTPTLAEGFSSIEEVPFVRKWPSEYKNKALILDFDDTLRRSIGPNEWPEKPEHVKVLPNRTDILKAYSKQGYLLLGASNQSAIAKGLSEADCIACFEETIKQLGIKVEYLYCPHRVPPVSCYCRKPAPGMGAYWIEKYKLDPSQSIMVGDATSDKTFAERCGFKYFHPDHFFK